MAEYIKREAALMKLMQDGCSAKTCNPSRICPPPMLLRWCMESGYAKAVLMLGCVVDVVEA